MIKKIKTVLPLQKKQPLLKLRFDGLPKISLNEWYAGIHWTQRKRVKDVYSLMITASYGKHIMYPCECEYDFGFIRNTLDVSNCVAMVKMIEDCLFPDDRSNMVTKITISSHKAETDYVELKIKAL